MFSDIDDRTRGGFGNKPHAGAAAQVDKRAPMQVLALASAEEAALCGPVCGEPSFVQRFKCELIKQFVARRWPKGSRPADGSCGQKSRTPVGGGYPRGPKLPTRNEDRARCIARRYFSAASGRQSADAPPCGPLTHSRKSRSCAATARPGPTSDHQPNPQVDSRFGRSQKPWPS
jgi:hypothetical protein